MSRLRVGVVGVGYLGRFHAEKYAAMDGVELVGVVDVDPIRAQSLAQTLNTRAFTLGDSLLGRVDAVSIVVPTCDHFEVALAFLKSGCDVLIEKPMTSNLEQADELIRCAETRGRIIQVGHLERFNSAWPAFAKDVGTPILIDAYRLSQYKSRGTDVSVVLDLMIHDIDLILQLVDSGLIDVRACGAAVVGEHTDVANAHLAFENGCVATLSASRISFENARQMSLYERDGYMSIDFADHQVSRCRRDAEDIEGPIPGMSLERQTLAAGDALKDEIAAFVAAAVHRRAPEVTGKMGRDALKVALDVEAYIQAANSRIGA